CSGAVIVEGMTKRGKPCRLIDNTASAPREELVALLNDLIEQEHFGPSGLSVAGVTRSASVPRSPPMCNWGSTSTG
ncbi:hypothetical protein GGI1_10580, partial [Acidithiobacillus sp. GGI-221]